MTMIDKDKIHNLLTAMGRGAYEREEAISLLLLSSLAGESIFLLGLPGVGKSMIARRLKMAFRNSTGFEYLMSRFSTPDEIFGPVSISKLKDEDTYERVTDGYLPTADVAFLDEIWKAGPAIQNSLLTVLNEKIFRNGEKELRLPLKGIIAASNELPAEGEGLEALWDRFLIRYVVRPIANKHKFLALLTEKPEECRIPEEYKISGEEYQEIRRSSQEVKIPAEIGELIYSIRMTLQQAKKNVDGPVDMTESDLVEPPYVSDRRWKKIVGLMRTCALLNGRDAVDASDALLLIHTLWDNDGQTESVDKLVAESIAATYKRYHADIPGVIGSGKLTKPVGKLVSDDGMHYSFMVGDEELRISIDDYKSLDTGKLRFGVIDNNGIMSLQDEETGLRVRKTADGIAVNAFSYQMKRDSKLRSGSVKDMMNGVKREMEDMESDFAQLVDDNIFLEQYESYPFLFSVFERTKLKTMKRGF